MTVAVGAMNTSGAIAGVRPPKGRMLEGEKPVAMRSADPWKELAESTRCGTSRLLPFSRHVVGMAAGASPDLRRSTMSDLKRTRRDAKGLPAMTLRRVLAPMLAVAAIALTTTTALAFTGVVQPKPQINVEAERSPQGARLTLKGKGWAPESRVKLTGTRAPGSNGMQELGTYTADAKGEFSERKIVGCSTNRMEDADANPVTITATDSATGAKATTKVQGGAWVCQ
jgi:methionine-rich copper-binding protein CopC